MINGGRNGGKTSGMFKRTQQLLTFIKLPIGKIPIAIGSDTVVIKKEDLPAFIVANDPFQGWKG